MSDINVNYNINHTPSPIGVNVAIQLHNTTVSATLVDIPAVMVYASPNYSANVGSDILSTIGTPLVNIITGALGLFATKIFKNQTYNLFSVPNMSFDVEGDTVKLLPTNLTLTDFHGMMLLTGDLDIK